MKKRNIARAATSVAAAAGIAAAGIVAAGPAGAQGPPFDLQISGYVDCRWAQPGDPWTNLWTMHRRMEVKNVGGRAAPNVVLQEIAGEQRFAEWLEPGKTLTIDTKWVGCWPSSISGYTFSSEIDPLLNNAGFWANVQFRDAE